MKRYILIFEDSISCTVKLNPDDVKNADDGILAIIDISDKPLIYNNGEWIEIKDGEFY